MTEKEFVMRGEKRFERRTENVAETIRSATETQYVPRSNNSGGFFSRLFCGRGSGGARAIDPNEAAPDSDFHADCFVQLSKGMTAYRFVEPSTATDDIADEIPVIVLLHGLTNCSYMWADVVDLLCDSEMGPQARVLVFDFYGHGRSPWTGVPITLDVLVTQTKELLDFLGVVTNSKVSIIGFDLGGAVATGFAAKYPNLCASLTLINPIGVKYRPMKNEKMLSRKYVGEYMILNSKNALVAAQEKEFFDVAGDSPHRPLVDRQTAMVQWQLDHTPGFLGAMLSAIRLFPLRGMEELYTAVGRHPRPVMIIWGTEDEVCPYAPCVRKMEGSFPKGCIVDIKECGHNSVFEKFDEVVTELLCFHKEIFTDEEDVEFMFGKR
jgi:pimeloyl-ACP methyl ester carboxylesterase